MLHVNALEIEDYYYFHVKKATKAAELSRLRNLSARSDDYETVSSDNLRGPGAKKRRPRALGIFPERATVEAKSRHIWINYHLFVSVHSYARHFFSLAFPVTMMNSCETDPCARAPHRTKMPALC